MESSLKLEGWQVQPPSPCFVDYFLIGLVYYKNPRMKSLLTHHPETPIPICLVIQQPKGSRVLMMLTMNQLHPLEVIAMESVIPTVSDRDTRTEAERGIKGGLEASPFADGIKFSARPRAPAGI